MKKFFPIFLIIIGLFLIAAVLFESQIYQITRKPPLVGEHKRVLYKLAVEAKKNGDLPISAVLLYDYTIVGQGYNTVLKDSNAAGHAEINALNDAIKVLGFEKFMGIGRDSLTLISTLDPCEMCKGTLQHYNIKYIQFLKEKPLSNSLDNLYKDFLYQVNKKQVNSEGFVDSLSNLHPDYKMGF